MVSSVSVTSVVSVIGLALAPVVVGWPMMGWPMMGWPMMRSVLVRWRMVGRHVLKIWPVVEVVVVGWNVVTPTAATTVKSAEAAASTESSTSAKAAVATEPFATVEEVKVGSLGKVTITLVFCHNGEAMHSSRILLDRVLKLFIRTNSDNIAVIVHYFERQALAISAEECRGLLFELNERKRVGKISSAHFLAKDQLASDRHDCKAFSFKCNLKDTKD